MLPQDPEPTVLVDPSIDTPAGADATSDTSIDVPIPTPVQRAANTSAHDMISNTRAPFRLFCGAKDPMVTVGELREFDKDAFDVEGCGHNVHIEAPAKVAEAVRKFHLQ